MTYIHYFFFEFNQTGKIKKSKDSNLKRRKTSKNKNYFFIIKRTLHIRIKKTK